MISSYLGLPAREVGKATHVQNSFWFVEQFALIVNCVTILSKRKKKV